MDENRPIFRNYDDAAFWRATYLATVSAALSRAGMNTTWVVLAAQEIADSGLILYQTRSYRISQDPYRSEENRIG